MTMMFTMGGPWLAVALLLLLLLLTTLALHLPPPSSFLGGLDREPCIFGEQMADRNLPTQEAQPLGSSWGL